MRQVDPPHAPSPRYLRATLITAIAMALLPALFLWSSYTDYVSSDWGPTDDSGAVQGFIFIGISCILVVGFSSAAYPMAAHLLHARRELTALRFVKVLTIWLATLSGVIGFSLGAFSSFFSIGLMFFVIASSLVLPFSVLWLRLAR